MSFVRDAIKWDELLNMQKTDEQRCISWHIWITWTSRYILLHASYCSVSIFQASILEYSYLAILLSLLLYYANTKTELGIVTGSEYNLQPSILL